jgi:hypothetical protein
MVVGGGGPGAGRWTTFTHSGNMCGTAHIHAGSHAPVRKPATANTPASKHCSSHPHKQTKHTPAKQATRATAHGPRPTAHGPRPTAHGPRPTAHGPRPTAHGPRPTAHGPRRPQQHRHTQRSTQHTAHRTQNSNTHTRARPKTPTRTAWTGRPGPSLCWRRPPGPPPECAALVARTAVGPPGGLPPPPRQTARTGGAGRGRARGGEHDPAQGMHSGARKEAGVGRATGRAAGVRARAKARARVVRGGGGRRA